MDVPVRTCTECRALIEEPGPCPVCAVGGLVPYPRPGLAPAGYAAYGWLHFAAATVWGLAAIAGTARDIWWTVPRLPPENKALGILVFLLHGIFIAGLSIGLLMNKKWARVLTVVVNALLLACYAFFANSVFRSGGDGNKVYFIFYATLAATLLATTIRTFVIDRRARPDASTLPQLEP